MRDRGRLPFRTKLLASYVGLVAAVEVITFLVLNQSLAADLVRHLDARLEEQARGAAEWVSARHVQHGERTFEASADRQAIRLAAVVHAWVTIIDANGTVIGDSEREQKDEESSIITSARPEILEARGGSVGHATRWSSSHNEDMHFVAVLEESGYVVRLAVPLAEIAATIRSMRNRLLVAAAFAFVVALGLGLFAARIIVRPLRAMTTTASRMAQGDYDIEVPPASPDEFGTLSSSLASLASQLKARIGDLTHERDRLSAILGAMVEGVIVIGPDRSVALANPSAARIIGASQPLSGRRLDASILDGRIHDVLAEADRGREVKQLELDVGSGESARSLILNLRPLAPAAGGGMVAVLHDVTQMRRLEGMRREFVANVSHELRTPVAAIQGYAETLLREGTLDAKTRGEFLDVIHRHARRIGRLVEDLLKLSEIESRPPEKIVAEAVRLFDVGANVRETARSRPNPKRASVEVGLGEELIALGDPDWIEQVLDNLVDNAMKYGREGGCVRIEGRREGERVRLTIADDGPGIAAQHLPRIFDRFYRVDAGRSREMGGTGLGLAIVKRLLESMGGSIAVESELGQGARFIVELPAAPSA